jgi:hypothetical protein
MVYVVDGWILGHATAADDDVVDEGRGGGWHPLRPPVLMSVEAGRDEERVARLFPNRNSVNYFVNLLLGYFDACTKTNLVPKFLQQQFSGCAWSDRIIRQAVVPRLSYRRHDWPSAPSRSDAARCNLYADTHVQQTRQRNAPGTFPQPRAACRSSPRSRRAGRAEPVRTRFKSAPFHQPCHGGIRNDALPNARKKVSTPGVRLGLI